MPCYMVEKLPLSGFPPLRPQKFKERALILFLTNIKQKRGDDSKLTG